MMRSLTARQAYRLWAPNYDVENPVTALDQIAVDQLTPPLTDRTLLDAGCGTCRRLPSPSDTGLRLAVGVDLVREMLLANRDSAAPRPTVLTGDVRDLPLASDVFDLVWCRLSIGHIKEIALVYREFARVTRRGAVIVVTDFHPAAAREGHVRRFRDAAGNSHVVEHYPHQVDDHEQAANAVGLRLEARLECSVGPDVRSYYVNAGMTQQYEEQQGLPLVLALRFML